MTQESEPVLTARIEAELNRLDPNGAFWDYTRPDGDSHVLMKNHGLASRIAAALAPTQPVPSGLDVERLAEAYHDAQQSHPYGQCVFKDSARDHAKTIAAIYDRLTTPVADEPFLDPEAWYEAFEKVNGYEAKTAEGRLDLFREFRDAYLMAWGRRLLTAPVADEDGR